MPLQIGNIRLGHATNSSSTHSIIFLKKKMMDDMAGQSEGEFGWQHFTASSHETKSRYLASLVRHEIEGIAGAEIADIVTSKWVGPGSHKDDYVDHQSALSLPLAWDGKGLEKQYLVQLKKFLLQDGIVILGGNDNTDEKHYLLEQAEQVFKIPKDRNQLVARWDERHQFWTLFDRRDGTKIRMRFLDPGEGETPIVKAEAPELVDLKITDYCPFGCEFCYQDSTEKGKHADFYEIERLIYNLAELRVFEVAIGGGEPTLHPKFLNILHSFKRSGIVPNFTTKRIDWLKDQDLAKEILSLVGGIGISIESPYSDIPQLAAHCILNNWDRDRFVLHHVMGSHDEYGFKGFLAEASKFNFPVLLLGWKNTGRGATARKHDYSQWAKWWNDLRGNDIHVQLSIDTALAKESEQALSEFKVSPRLYERHEGRFSMYIDAVAQTAAASSYGHKAHPLKTMGGNGSLSKEIKNLFAKF